MQAVKAYYDNGKFVPMQPVVVPKGSYAIITILDFPIDPSAMDANVPNQETLQAFYELDNDIDTTTHETIDDMVKSWGL